MSKRALFYTAWLLVHILQAQTTELFDDEAYYWVYSLFPAWGYFDHPPVIALLIKAGYTLFHHELGVRIFSAILSTAALFLIEELLEQKNRFLFYAICASFALAQIGGMLAVPDTPLMFFVALFFWFYRRFLEKMTTFNAIALGICIAAMLYTKYHGVLVVLFTGLSHLRLLRYWPTYLAIGISILLFVPHLYWQYLHDYPSVQFHLFERNSGEYEVKNTFNYIGGQILLAGPIAGWLLILAALKSPPHNDFQRGLKYTFVGIYLFFLLSTLKGRAEANWTIPSFIGMIVLAHQYLHQEARWRKWLYFSVPFTLVLVVAARILMMVDMPPAWWLKKDEFHRNKVWTAEIKQKAGGLPVVFQDSYQRPSKYWFYTGDTAMSLNTPRYRRNNFNFWPIEDALLGRPVYLAKEDKILEEYFSFQRVMVDNIRTQYAGDGEYSIQFRTISPAHYLPFLHRYDATLFISLYRKKKLAGNYSTTFTTKDIRELRQQNLMTVRLNTLPKGVYTAKIALGSCLPGSPSLNSAEFRIELR